MRRAVLSLLVLALVLVPAVAGTSATTTVKKVAIHDNYYNPLNLKVKEGTTV